MLDTISWPQYVAAVIILSAAWYGYVALRYYRTELASFFKLNGQARPVVPTVAAATEVLGSIRQEAGEITPDPENLIFAENSSDDISDQTLPKGPGDDLLAEAQALVSAYETNDNKLEFLAFLRQLINSYEMLSDEISLTQVIESLKQFAKGKLPFSLQETEWPLNF